MNGCAAVKILFGLWPRQATEGMPGQSFCAKQFSASLLLKLCCFVRVVLELGSDKAMALV